MLKNILNFILLVSLAFDVSGACLDGRVHALKKGGFSGPFVCDSKDASFRFLGVLSSDTIYYVYDYQYRFKSKNMPVYHGGQRLIVFDRVGEYLGQYALTAPPNFDLIIAGTQIIVNAHGVYKGAIEFANGPELNSYIDDEPLTFFR